MEINFVKKILTEI